MAKDFIANFLEWSGESECPPEYLKWSAISLLAAACGNRIYTHQWIGHSRMNIYPNLYMILVGPSGNFKSFAMSRVRAILEKTNYSDKLNLYAGHVTHAGLYEAMRAVINKKNRKTGETESTEYPFRKQFYLLNDELANDIGGAEFADMFIKAITELYMLQPFDDRTRSSGHIHIEDYSFNWFGATTIEWLIRAITRDVLVGGFLGRTIIINQGMVDKRIWRTKPPENYDTLFKSLAYRIDELMVMRGFIPKTKEAWEIERHWYLSRKTPNESDPTMGAWMRQYTLSIKLSLILCLSRYKEAIDDQDVADAQEMTESIVKWQKSILPSIEKGSNLNSGDRLLAWVRSRAQVKRAELSKIAYDKYGIHSAELEQLVRTWLDAKFIREQKRPRAQGGITYTAREL